MTNQGAIDSLRKEYCKNCYGADYGEFENPNKCDNCEIELAIKAIEKQIPQRVLDIDVAGLDKVGSCPSCGKDVTNYFDYCPRCSQALDWSK